MREARAVRFRDRPHRGLSTPLRRHARESQVSRTTGRRVPNDLTGACDPTRTMPPILRVVLDLLKPHEPTIQEVSQHVANADGVAAVNAVLLETDRETENVKLTVEGESIDYPGVRETIEKLGGTVHSVDQVACGEYIVEESETPQD